MKYTTAIREFAKDRDLNLVQFNVSAFWDTDRARDAYNDEYDKQEALQWAQTLDVEYQEDLYAWAVKNFPDDLAYMR